MKRKHQIQWLKHKRKGFLFYVLTSGMPFSIPMILGSAFIKNDFYLDVFSPDSFYLYIKAVIIGFFYAGATWLAYGYIYVRYKKSLAVGKNAS
jgi:membrane protease YdiL (CAAX protease family)